MKFKTGDKLRYIPRNTYYDVVINDIEMKCGSEWLKGCIYVCEITGKKFCRSYKSFSEGEDKWELNNERLR